MGADAVLFGVTARAYGMLFICFLVACCCFQTSGSEVRGTSPSVSSKPSSDSRNNISSVYTYTEEGGNIDSHQSWIYVRVKVVDNAAHQSLLQLLVPNPGKVDTKFFVKEHVYVSLTTMASRIHNVSEAIVSLVEARVVPTKIFLVISKNPHLLDIGVQVVPDDLLCLAAAGYLNVIFTANTGPHRKLLPVLKRYWNRDVFIATVDDDMSRAQGYIILYQLLKTHVLNNQTNAVVALRARRIALCSSAPYRVTKYSSWPVVQRYNHHEMLLLPTGTGGVLYQPKQFHKVVFAKPFWYATGTADDLMFRLATMVRNVSVLLGCSVMVENGFVRTCPQDEIDYKYDAKYGTNSTVYYASLLKTNEATSFAMVDTAKNTDSIPSIPSGSSSNSSNNSRSSDSGKRNSHSKFKPSVERHTPLCASNDPCNASASAVATINQPLLHPHIQPQLHPNLHANRRLYSLKKALTRQKRTGNETELFAINKKGGNDLAWKLATDVLKTLIKLDFSAVVKSHLYEREEYCYSRNKTAEVERHCAIYECGKSNKRIIL